VPFTQIRTDEGSSSLLSVKSPDRTEHGSSAAVRHPFYPETGTGNRNKNDVIPNVCREVRGYIGAQPTALESHPIGQPVALESYTAIQPMTPESCQASLHCSTLELNL